MNEQRKKRIRIILKKVTAAFLMYAFLPLVCGTFLSLFLVLNSVGIERTEAAFFELGDKTLYAAVGAVAEKEETQSGFYFLSPELNLPMPSAVKTIVGCATYFKKAPASLSSSSDKSTPAEQTETEASKISLTLYEALPAGATPVIGADLSSSSFVINTTQYEVSKAEVLSEPFPISSDIPEDGPLVLVLHTHGTESYLEDRTNLSDFAADGIETYFLKNETSFRTNNPEKSVVRVGKVFSDTLNALGIPTLHVTTMHDKDDFNSAYVNSAETVKKMLAEYPSIQYVIDLHRDSVERSGSYVKTKTVLEGKSSAQVMLVVGTNQNGRHPLWRQNLRVATAFRDKMDLLYPTLSRSLYLRTSRFNQEYLPGCLLLEVGSAANTLEEAKVAAELSAKSLAAMIKGL